MPSRLSSRAEARLDVAEASRLRFAARKVGRHLRWLRTEGLARLIEEDELNPVDRFVQRRAKAQWRAAHPQEPGSAVPVYVVGVQRSGTNMMVRGLVRAPEFETHNENDQQAFRRYRLREDAAVSDLLRAARQRFVLLKPLCDSHDTDRMLDTWGGRAVWAYRGVDGRVRSAVRKFGEDDRQVMAAIAHGTAGNVWHAARLSPETLETIRRLEPGELSTASASALFWWARNTLFFDTGLDQRSDVMLASYEAFLADSEREMRAVCEFLGIAFRPSLVAAVEARAGAGPALDLDPRVRALCEEIAARLDAAHLAARARAAASLESGRRSAGSPGAT